MIDINSGVVIVFSMLLIYLVFDSYVHPMVMIKSKVNSKSYLVHDDFLKRDTANLLAKLSEKSIKLITYLLENFPENEKIRRLKRFKPYKLREKKPNTSGTSFTLGKRAIVLCLKKNNNKELIDGNTAFFVLLHEVAHIMTVSVGHTDQFWENFKFLLAHAIDQNLYTYDNYEEAKRYCGIEITSSPLNFEEVDDYVN
jgi:hypothetical protein